MSPLTQGSQDERLNALFHAYREACEAPEPNANFMPQLWQRIEARQGFSFSFGRVARGFVTAAVALTLVMAIYLSVPRRSAVFYSENYIEALASSRGDLPDDAIPFEPGAGAGELQ
jgi:hypothetical protein